MREAACQAKELQLKQKAVLLHINDVGKEIISGTRRVAHHVGRFFPRTGKQFHQQILRKKRYAKTFGVQSEIEK